MTADSADRMTRKVRGWFVPFLIVFVILAGLSYSIARPLITSLAWAGLFSFFTYPLYRLLHEKVFAGRWANLSAFVTTMVILVLIIVPGVYASFALAREGIKLYGKIAGLVYDVGRPSLVFLPPTLMERLQPLFEQFPFLGNILQEASSWIASFIANVSRQFLGSAVRLIPQLVVITVASFFMTRDGHVILEYIGDIVPLPAEERRALFLQARKILGAVIYGVLFTASVQGILGGLGWWYVGLSAPVLFGAIMGLLAMIPFIGTPLVWIPGAIYLFFNGQWKAALILFVWGIVVVSTIDNVIRPFFISEGSKLHILIVFIGVVGGLATWGFLGIFYGPLVISLFVFLLDSYRRIWKTYLVSSDSGRLVKPD